MTTTYRFGHAELRPGERRLLISGEDVRLGGRAFDLLVELVEQRAEVVGKDALIERVWPGLVVEESNLSVQIAALRKVLGPDVIQTVSGRGYRFCARVAEASNDALGFDAPVVQAFGVAASAGRVDNLPPSTGTLFGRVADLKAVAALLAAHPVVSIIGSGGIGKSRLGLEAAIASRALFADGVWWVDLAAIDRPELLPSAVAGAMGLQLAGNTTALAGLCGVLGGLRALVVLDNCEQVAEGVARLIDAVRARTRDVRFLTTSQEPVNATGEWIFRPDALDVPTESTLEAAQRSNAVALFVDRASAVEPRFALDAGNFASVIDICARLDGIPLALQLAAARVPLLGVQGLRSRLDQRLRLLAGRSADANAQPRRQQTLRAALEWSWDLLSSDESAVLQRLGVFAGGFTLELAQAVVTDGAIDAWLVLDLLGRLVDKSLVVVDLDGPRYRLLETTRLYALEQLDANGQARHWRHRHATAMLELLKCACDARWLARPGADSSIARELDNARVALEWSLAADGERELALALHGASMQLWIAAGLKAEGSERCAALSTWIDDEVPAATAAQFWLTVAMMGLHSSRLACFEAAERAALLFRQLGDARRAYEALIVRIAVAARRSEHAAAAQALAEANQLLDPLWPARRRSALAFAAWVAALNARREAEAVDHAWDEVALAREAGSLFDEGVALAHVGSAAIYVPGQERRGEALLHDAAALMAAAGRPNAAGHPIYSLCVVLLRRGAPEAALAQACRAYPMLKREGEQSLMLGLLPLLALHCGRLEDASRAAGYAAAVYARSGLPPRGFFKEAVSRLQHEVPAADYARWTAQGANLSDDAAYALVLRTEPRQSESKPQV